MEKRENGKEKKENCKKEGGKSRIEAKKWAKWAKNPSWFFYFFFFFSFFFLFFSFSLFFSFFWKPLTFVWTLPKWKFLPGKKHFTPGKKLGKVSLPPPPPLWKNIPLAPLSRYMLLTINWKNLRQVVSQQSWYGLFIPPWVAATLSGRCKKHFPPGLTLSGNAIS